MSYSGSYNNTTWTISDSGAFSVSGTGEICSPDASSEDIPWKQYRSKIKTVNINEGITVIGQYAFYDCNNLKSVTISNTVTQICTKAFLYCDSLTNITIPNSVTTIGSSVFNGCSSLTSIEIPNSVTTIGSSAFSRCSGLTSIEIPDSVTAIGSSAFTGCSGLTSLEISDSVTAIDSSVFNGCSSLTSIEIPNSVTTIGSSAFSGCSGLTSIEIPDSVTAIYNSAFSDCSSLTSIEIPDSVTTIANSVFKNCSSLTSVKISNNVTKISFDTFYKCSNLTDIVIPNYVTSIEQYAFYNCSNLISVTIPYYIENIDKYAFIGCEVLENVYYAGNKNEWNSITIGTGNDLLQNANFYYCLGYCGDNLIWSFNDETGVLSITGTGDMYGWEQGYEPWANHLDIKTVIIEEGVTDICDNAFYLHSNLENITIPNSVIRIGNDAFIGCCFVNIEIPNSVEIIGIGAFAECEKLKTVTIGNGVTNIDEGAFSDCNSLENVCYKGAEDDWNAITIKNGNDCLTSANIYYNSIGGVCRDNLTWRFDKNTGVLTIEGTGEMWDFEWINNEADLSTPWFSIQNEIQEIILGNEVKSIGNLAFYCFRGSKIRIPGNIERIGDEAFINCDNCTELIIEEGVKYIGNGAFAECRASDIIIPKSVITIGVSAFTDCINLKKVNIVDIGAWCNINFHGEYSNPLTYSKQLFLNNELVKDLKIPDTVTNINRYVFNNCESLESVTINKNIEHIDEYAFNNCTNLSNIYYEGAEEEWASVTKETIGNTYLLNATVHFSITEKCGENLNCTYTYGDQNLLISGSGAMYDWSSYSKPWAELEITTLVIEEGITSISDNSFNDNYSSEMTVHYKGTVEEWNDIIIGNNNSSLKDKTIYFYKGICGEGLIWTFDIIANELLISGAGEMFDWIEGETPWNNYLDIIKKVIIEEGIKSIGDYAFSNCENLISISIPDNVTTIGKYAFKNCLKLITINIPNNIIELKEGVFDGCAGLETIEIPTNITIIKNYVFRNCNNLNSITISNSVKTIEDRAFENIEGLIIYYKGAEWEWNDITQIRSNGNITIYFYKGYCGNVENGNNLIWEYDIDTYTLNIDGEGEMYNWEKDTDVPWYINKTDIQTINISNGITSIGNRSFLGCSQLQNITIPNSVTNIGNFAFANCRQLANVKLPNGILNIGTRTFFNCIQLQNIILPDSVINIDGWAFCGCTNLRSIEIPDNVVFIDKYAFSNCSNLINFSCKSKKINIAKIAFNNCTGLIKTDNGEYIKNNLTNKRWLLEQTVDNNLIEIPSDIEVLCTNSVRFPNIKGSVIVTLPSTLNSVSNKSFILNDSISEIEFICENPKVALGSSGIVLI